MNKTIRQQYRKNSKKSLCKSKTAKKCKKIKGCKHVSGKKRSFCRKIKNKRYNKTKKFKGGEQICSPTNFNFDPCSDAELILISRNKNNSHEIKRAAWNEIDKRIEERELATAAIKDRQSKLSKGIKDKDKLNEAKRKRDQDALEKRLKQKKQALAKLLNNPTEPNSTETHIPFSPESECSTTNLGSCSDDKLYDIAIDENNSKKNRVEAGLGMI